MLNLTVWKPIFKWSSDNVCASESSKKCMGMFYVQVAIQPWSQFSSVMSTRVKGRYAKLKKNQLWMTQKVSKYAHFQETVFCKCTPKGVLVQIDLSNDIDLLFDDVSIYSWFKFPYWFSHVQKMSMLTWWKTMYNNI